MLYKAFISYSHAADGKLAPALQSGLQSFARPWHRLRAMRVFRDKTSLAVSPALWPAIERALDQSEYFILLASPEAAASPWVRREIEHWLTHRSAATLLIALTHGTLVWDAATRRFDPARTTAFPTDTGAAFDDEPLYLDLRWAADEAHLSMRNPRFRDGIADLAATLHGRSKDDLVGEDVRRHRGAMRLAWSAIIALTALTIGAGVAAYLAIQQRNLASERLRVALSRQLAVEALQVDEQRLDLALLLAVEANRQARTAEAATTMKRLLERAARLRVVLHDTIASFTFSADGTRLALGLTDGSLRHVDTTSFRPMGEPVRLSGRDPITRTDSALQQPAGLPMTPRPEKVSWLAFLPGTLKLLFASPSDNYHPPLHTLWLAEGESAELRRLDRAHRISFSEQRQQAIALFEVWATGTRVLFWSGSQGRLLGPFAAHKASPLWTAFSSDGERMVVGYHDGTLELWQGLSASPAARAAAAPTQATTSAVFSADGRRVFLGLESGEILQLDAESGRELLRLAGGHTTRVVGLAAGPEDDRLRSIAEDGAVLDWRIGNSQRPFLQVNRLPPPVGAIAFDRTGQTLAALQRQSNREFGALTLWTDVAPRGIMDYAMMSTRVLDGLAAGEPLPLRPAQTRVANDMDRPELVRRGGLLWSFHPAPLAFDPTGRWLATALPDDRLALWTLGEQRSFGWQLNDAVTGLTAAALSPDGRLLAWGSGDSVNTFDLERGVRLPPISVPTRTVTSLAFSADSQWIVFADLEQRTFGGRLHIVNAATRVPRIAPLAIASEEGGSGWVVGVSFVPGQPRVAARRYEGQLTLWDFETAAVRTFEAPETPQRPDMVVHPQRPLMVTVEEEAIRFVDLGTGQRLDAPVLPLTSLASGLVFHPNGRWLTVATEDGAVRTWDLETGQPMGRSLQLASAPSSLAYDAAGRHLAVVSSTRAGATVQLWDVERGVTVLPDLTPPRDGQIMLTPRGDRLILAGEGFGPTVWNAQIEMWMAAACAAANRELSDAEWARYLPDETFRRTCDVTPR